MVFWCRKRLLNESFSQSPECIELYVKWFLSPHCYLAQNLPHYELPKQPILFNKYAYLIEEGRIKLDKNQGTVKRFLNWVNGWPEWCKHNIKKRLDELKAKFPQYTELWELVSIPPKPDSPRS